MKRILLLRFSHRQAGNCAAIASHIRASLPAGTVSEFVMDGESCRSCQGCDYQCLRGEGDCPHQNGAYSDAMKAIMASDLVYFILPNYCGFPCASYFAFNERSVGFFHGDAAILESYLAVPKRFLIVSNTESQVFTEAMQQQQVSDEPIILYLKSGIYGKKSICGDILTSEQARADLEHFLQKDNS